MIIDSSIVETLQNLNFLGEIETLPDSAEIGTVYTVTDGGGYDANGTAIKSGDTLIYTDKGWLILDSSLAKYLDVKNIANSAADLPSNTVEIGATYKVLHGGGTMNEELGIRN